MKLLAYTRVSTVEQEESAHSLDAQEHALVQHVTSKGWWIVRVAREQGSGKDLDRPKLQSVLQALADGKADGLIVTKLDRLTRSIVDFVHLIEWFERAGKVLVVLDFNLDTSTAAGKMLAQMLVVLAEWERSVIGERTRAALQEKRRRGEPVNQGGIVDHPELLAQIRTYRDAGFTQRQIADQLNADGVPTLRGGVRWHQSALTAVLREKPAPVVQKRAKLPEVR
jgi:DNA invertase Pin-like site-specific DNA recombinase